MQRETMVTANTIEAFNMAIPVHVSITVGKPVFASRPSAGVQQDVEGVGVVAEGFFTPAPPAVPMSRFRLDSLKAEKFDWNAALSLGLASTLAYQGAAEVESVAVSTFGFERCEFFDVDDTQGFVAWTNEVVLIAFRGTESLGDWLIDLNILSSSRPYGIVHRGFLGAFQVVEARLREILSGLSGRLVLTGHSLGGALATVAAAEFLAAHRASAIYTYGQPAAGKGKFPKLFADEFAGRFHRFVNDDDIVAQVPPTFVHVGDLIHFDADGNIQSTSLESLETSALAPGLSQTSPPEPMLSEQQFDQLRATLIQERARTASDTVVAEGFFPSVRDHKMARYLAKIIKHVPNP